MLERKLQHIRLFVLLLLLALIIFFLGFLKGVQYSFDARKQTVTDAVMKLNIFTLGDFETIVQNASGPTQFIQPSNLIYGVFPHFAPVKSFKVTGNDTLVVSFLDRRTLKQTWKMPLTRLMLQLVHEREEDLISHSSTEGMKSNWERFVPSKSILGNWKWLYVDVTNANTTFIYQVSSATEPDGKKTPIRFPV
jgi:hypothetical protein